MTRHDPPSHGNPNGPPTGPQTITAAYESLADTSKHRVIDLLEEELLRMGNHEGRESLKRCRKQIDAHIDLTARLFAFLVKVEQVALRNCSDELRSQFPPLSYRTVERMSPEPMLMVLKLIQTELERKRRPGLAAETVDFRIELQGIVNKQLREELFDGEA